MISTEERLSRLEARVEAVEALLADAKAKVEVFTRSPGARKLAALLGVRLP